MRNVEILYDSVEAKEQNVLCYTYILSLAGISPCYS